MPEFRIDPFEKMRKNAHIWRGENSLIWYNEMLDGSMVVQIFYDFGDKKRHVYLEVHDKNRKVEFRNIELPPENYNALLKEVELVEALLEKNKRDASK